jgi:bifunctional non-homologous end joining protein LigD
VRRQEYKPALGLDWSDKFPEIVAEAASCNADYGSARLERSSVLETDRAATNFSALQQAISDGRARLSLFLFDALEGEWRGLAHLPNLERKARPGVTARRRTATRDPLCRAYCGQGEQLFDAICEAGGEGIISKKADAPYRSPRTKCWLKIKCIRRQEFVVIGWSKARPRAAASLADPGGE